LALNELFDILRPGLDFELFHKEMSRIEPLAGYFPDTVKIKTFHLNETTQELEPVQYINLYKDDLSSYSFNLDRFIDPYVYIETQSFNDYGLGYTNSKLLEFNEGRNFVLIDNNFTGINYKYITTDYGYYIITDGRFYIIPY
jgi:hypothetical protein